MSNTPNSKTPNSTHILIIPFTSLGHLIPLLDLTHCLLTHHPNPLTITFLTTPTTLPFLQPLLTSLYPLIPPPTSFSFLSSLILSLQSLQPSIISWFNDHPSPPRVLLSDYFLTWTHSLSTTLSLPRVVFYPSGPIASSIYLSLWASAPSNPAAHPNFLVRFDDIPGSPLFKWSELHNQFLSSKTGDPGWDRFREEMLSNLNSWGAVFNTISDLESEYNYHFKTQMGHDRVWAMGLLLPQQKHSTDVVAHRGWAHVSEEVLTWLNGKEDGSVVYVCFGSRAFLTQKQAKVLGEALECSGVHFIWCVRQSDGGKRGMPDLKYEDRVAGRGFVIKGWAPQVAILRHKSVATFLTHCGWNSAMEAVSAGVMMVGWPMGADQYWVAWLVVDRLGLGLMVDCDGPNGFPMRVSWVVCWLNRWDRIGRRGS